MQKEDYIRGLKIPSILLILHMIIAFYVSWHFFKDIATYDQVLKVMPRLSIYSVFLSALSYGIVLYSGYTAIRKFNGTIKNSIFLGFFVGIIQVSLAFFNSILMYYLIEGYRVSLSPAMALGDIGVFAAIITIVVGIPFTLAIDIASAAIGGFIATQLNKQQL